MEYFSQKSTPLIECISENPYLKSKKGEPILQGCLSRVVELLSREGEIRSKRRKRKSEEDEGLRREEKRGRRLEEEKMGDEERMEEEKRGLIKE